MSDPFVDAARGTPTALPRYLFMAKTAVPRLLNEVVTRQRLLDRMPSRTGAPVTVVTAPAGSGKTQLLACWATQGDLPVAWVTLDHGDRDPLRFWTAVIAAARRCVPEAQQSALAHLAPAPEGGYPTPVLPALVVDALAAVEHELAIVLDDVHVLAGAPSVAGLADLMLQLPTNVRLVLGGQYLPSLPVAKLALAGAVTTIDASALAFTVEEADEMLRSAGVSAPRDAVEELCRRTEGWSAGLRLATLAHPPSRTGDLPGMTGLPAAGVADYLVTEVVENLAPATRDFLRDTCVCERISGSLADALTGRDDGRSVLSWLAERNVFTVRLTEGDEWFRYHSLFAATLRARLELADPGRAREQHAKAARWYEDRGILLDSFDHAVRAEDGSLARRTFLRHWLSAYLDGELVSLRELVLRLPATLRLQDPLVSHLRVIVGLALDDPELSTPPEVELTGEEREEATEAPTPVLVLRLMRAQARADVEEVRRASQALLDLADRRRDAEGVTNDLKALALQVLGVAEYWTGKRDSAERHLRDALEAARCGRRRYVELGCLGQLVGVLTAQDRLTDALSLAREGAALARSQGWEQTAAAAELWHALGWIHYLRDDLDASDGYLDLADDAVRRDDAPVRATIQLVRALVLAQRGHKRKALAELEDARTTLHGIRGRYVFGSYVDAEVSRLSLALGRVSAARAALPGPYLAGESVHLSLARAELLLGDGRPEDALALVARAVTEGEGYLDQRIQVQVLCAVLRYQQEGLTSGVEAMRLAVRMATPEQMVQPFLGFGPRVERLVEGVPARDAESRAFVAKVRRHLALTAARPSLDAPAPVLAEPLTARETDVLVRLETLATLPEIAADLFVSVNTVKVHLRSLYRKLAVHGRREAVARARELGLL